VKKNKRLRGFFFMTTFYLCPELTEKCCWLQLVQRVELLAAWWWIIGMLVMMSVHTSEYTH
jgi:hypothetical protein